MRPPLFAVFGILFGFTLSRARATDYDTIASMFRLMDLHLMFVIGGAGWALSGACPGTSLVQVGEGKLVALFTVVGILTGTYLYGWVRSNLGRSISPRQMAQGLQ